MLVVLPFVKLNFNPGWTPSSSSLSTMKVSNGVWSTSVEKSIELRFESEVEFSFREEGSDGDVDPRYPANGVTRENLGAVRVG